MPVCSETSTALMMNNFLEANTNNTAEQFKAGPFKRSFAKAKSLLQSAIHDSKYQNAISKITGDRGYYDGVQHLKGHPVSGRVQGHAEGLQKEIYENVGKLALARPDVGLCYYWIGTRCTMEMLHPRYIYQAFVRNNDKLSRSLAVENNFSLGFGKHTVFTLPTDAEWKQKRDVMKEAVYDDVALKRLAKPMQEIIEQSINKLTASNKPVDLDHFFCQITMDVMARTQLGADDKLAENIEIFTQAFEKVLASIFEFNSVLKQRLIESFRDKYNLSLKTTKIEEARDELYDVIKKHYLSIYKDKLVISDNLVSKMLQVDFGKGLTPADKEFALYLKEVLGQLALTFLVGHDTTARLLHFAQRLLTRNPECLAKLRKEIVDYRAKHAIKIWSREDLTKLPYLQMVLREALRLYPSAPIMGYLVQEELILGDIPLVKNAKEYDEAMAKRDKSHDIKLFPSDIVILAAPLTHRLAEFYPDPESFKPERWSYLKNPENLEDAKAIMSYNNNDATFLGFGVGKRACVGKNFAIQEASLTLIQLAEKFDITINNDDIYPFPVEVVGTVRPAKTEPGKNVTGLFKPRVDRNMVDVKESAQLVGQGPSPKSDSKEETEASKASTETKRECVEEVSRTGFKL